MTALSRRKFLGIAATLSGAWALPVDEIAVALARKPQPADVMTTLVGTIRKGPSNRFYKPLVARPGEKFVVREDLLLKPPDPGRANRGRSLIYFGQFTDVHIVDAQSPARSEPIQQLQQTLNTVGAARPQETLTAHVLNQMVEAMNEAASSPVTGAPLALAVVTGDSADSHAHTELTWYVKCLDGVPFMPDSGKAGVYEGVQVWGEAWYAYHPDDPSDDLYGKHDFPAFPGMLQAAVGSEIRPAGLSVPWYALYGNHDVLWMGTAPASWIQTQAARGKRKGSRATAEAFTILAAGSANGVFEREALSFVWDHVRGVPGIRTVSRDPKRRLFELSEFMREHLDSPDDPGPRGHGFTEENVRTGRTYWAHDVGPRIRLIGLNSCNLTEGADGSLPEDQYVWLERELRRASSRYFDTDGTERPNGAQDKLIIVCSHHTSFTMDNVVQPAVEKKSRLYTGPEVVDLLLRYPNVIAWINGHTHFNQILAHRNPRLDDGSGFWEINTAACIDWGQQARLVELVDNRDGTLSIFAIILDHKSAAEPDPDDLSIAGLASISRELAANHWFNQPDMRLGSREDRNTELPLRAPFDLSVVTDEDVEAVHAGRRARLLARRPV